MSSINEATNSIPPSNLDLNNQSNQLKDNSFGLNNQSNSINHHNQSINHLDKSSQLNLNNESINQNSKNKSHGDQSMNLNSEVKKQETSQLKKDHHDSSIKKQSQIHNNSNIESNPSIINQAENQLPSIHQEQNPQINKSHETSQIHNQSKDVNHDININSKVLYQGSNNSQQKKQHSKNSSQQNCTIGGFDSNIHQQSKTHKQQQQHIQVGQSKLQSEHISVATQSKKQQSQLIKEKNIHETFQRLDQNKDGKLTIQQLEHVAKEMNIQTISHQQIEQFIKQADTLKDNKITFQQFKAWFNRYSHVESTPFFGKINRLIAYKNQSLPKLIKLSSHKSQQQKVLSQKIDKIHLNFQLGDHIQKQSQTKIKLNVHIGEKLYQKQIKQLRQKGIQLNQESFGVVIQFQSEKPDQSKQTIQTKINQLKNHSKNSLINSFDFNFKSTKHLTLVHLTSKKLQQQFTDIITFMKEKGNMQGENYFFKAQTDLFVKNGLDKSLKSKFINWILNGFKFKIDIEGSGLFLKNLRKSFQSQFDSYLVLLSLLQNGKIDLKFKDIKNVQDFLAKLGIKELAEQTPLLEELLAQFIGIYSDSFTEQKQLLFVKTLFDSVLELASSKICVSIFVGHLRVYLQIETDSFKGVSKLIK